MELKATYKKSDIGVFPEDWDIVRIAQVAERITVGFVGTMAYLFTRQGVPLLRGQNVLPNKLDLTETLYISEETHKLWQKSALQSGDIVLVRVGYPGTACVIPKGLGEANAASLVIVRPCSKKIQSTYLSHVLNSDFGKKQIDSYLVGGAQQVFNTKTAASFALPLPPIKEQQAIAEALNDTDALIEGLEQLIAKKRQIKQGAMQELLTGKTRLQDYKPKSGYKQTEIGMIPEDWVVTTLREVVNSFVNGGTPSTRQKEYWKGTIPWITGNDIVGQNVSEIRRYITREAVTHSSTNIIKIGNLLLVTRTGVGKLAVAPFDVAISQDFTGVYLDQKKLKVEYLFWYLDLNRSNLIKHNQGTSILGITRETLSAFTIYFPSSIAEQSAIASVLSDMDAEIAALVKKRDKTQLIKQGMMQELLSGRIRFV